MNNLILIICVSVIGVTLIILTICLVVECNQTKYDKYIALPNKYQEKFYYQKHLLKNREIYYDSGTMKNKLGKINTSIIIGQNKDKNPTKWSRISMTTSPTKNINERYIRLDKKSKEGKKAYLNKKILTSSISSKKSFAKNRYTNGKSPITNNDLRKIKLYINANYDKIIKQ